MNRVESPEPAAPTADTSGVRVPPPSYHVAGFLAGGALELASPTPWPAAGIRIAVAVLAAFFSPLMGALLTGYFAYDADRNGRTATRNLMIVLLGFSVGGVILYAQLWGGLLIGF